MPADPITAISNVVDTVLHSVLPDPVAQAQAKLQLATLVSNGTVAKMTQAAGVITAEANSKFALAAVWRPITMLTFVAIVANNYILAPYLHAMFGWSVTLDMPTELWELLKIGLGGYVLGRSGEKMVAAYRGNTNVNNRPPAPSTPEAFNLNGG